MAFTPFKFKVTERFLRRMEQLRFFSSLEKSDPKWLSIDKTIKIDAPVFLEPYSAIRSGPKFFSIGAYSYSRSSFASSVKVGRYCAIGPNVEVMGVNHPMQRLSISGLDYSVRPHFKAARSDFGKGPDIVKRGKDFSFRPPSIGNDVWIGQDVLIAQGIHIGTGAIVGARSVVTKDVPPYSIVAGTPAVVKKMRFPEPLIERLLGSQWWNYNFVDFEGMDTTEPGLFLEELNRAADMQALSEWSPKTIAIHEEAQAFGILCQ